MGFKESSLFIQMTTSHLNRIRNEIEDLRDQSDRKLSLDNHYVVEIFLKVEDIPQKVLINWGKEIIREDKPLLVYVRPCAIFIFFASNQNPKESHQVICSDYSSKYTEKLYKNDLQGRVRTTLTELSTQHAVFAYLLWRSIETQFQLLSKLLNIPMHKIYQLTLNEASTKSGNRWESSSKFDKFGTVFKLREKKGKTVITSFSKPIDSRRRDHYLSYLFGTPETD